MKFLNKISFSIGLASPSSLHGLWLQLCIVYIFGHSWSPHFTKRRTEIYVKVQKNKY